MSFMIANIAKIIFMFIIRGKILRKFFPYNPFQAFLN